MSIKDKLSIYKLLVAKIDTLSNAKEPDDFAIDLNTAVSFYNKTDIVILFFGIIYNIYKQLCKLCLEPWMQM